MKATALVRVGPKVTTVLLSNVKFWLASFELVGVFGTGWLTTWQAPVACTRLLLLSHAPVATPSSHPTLALGVRDRGGGDRRHHSTHNHNVSLPQPRRDQYTRPYGYGCVTEHTRTRSAHSHATLRYGQKVNIFTEM